MTAHLSINQMSLEKLTRAWNEPCWLRNRRLGAFEKFKKLPPSTVADSPTQKRYTELDEEQLKGIFLGPPKSDSLPEIVSRYAALLDQSQAFGIFENLNWKLVGREENLSKLGIIFTSLRNALGEHSDLVERHLNKTVEWESEKFAALATACWQDGVFLFVPPHTRVKLPIKTLFATQGSNTGWFSHSLIIVEEGSQLDYVEVNASPEAEKTAWHSDVVEVLVGPGSRVNYYGIQQWSKNSYNFGLKKAVLHEGAEMNWATATFGSKIAKVMVENSLRGQHAESGNFGVFLGCRGQHIDISNNAHHLAPNTCNEIFTRGALIDNGTSVYRGLIKIDREAKHTDSNMSEYTLLLSDKTRANAVPALEIETNNVRAKHAAAVGQIDKDQLFYLMSRGLNKTTAERLIVRGFFESVLQNVKLQQVKNFIAGTLEESLVEHEPKKTS